VESSRRPSGLVSRLARKNGETVPLSEQEQIRIAEKVFEAVEAIPDAEKLGFLFGVVIGYLFKQGLSKDAVRASILTALDYYEKIILTQ
jgi:hypothetical protein